MLLHPFHSILLTPGPVSLSFSTKREMLVDYAMDGRHIEKEIAFCRKYLLEIANGAGIATAVPLAGSATAGNEAAIQTLVPAGGKVLIYTNGVFGDRLCTICEVMRVPHSVLRLAPTQPLTVEALAHALTADPDITHVMVVHCETSSGILNPIEGIADLCRMTGKRLLIDAVSSFGALPIDLEQLQCDALILGGNKCLQGPPGLCWILARSEALAGCQGNARSLTLDLWDQWQHFEVHNSFRFTPPTHIIAAFAQALREHRAEGGQPARLQRYARNRRRLVEGMRALGFKPLLPESISGPVVATFVPPGSVDFDAVRFCRQLTENGFQISLRRAAVANTLRIGCIGELDEDHIEAALIAIRRVMAEIGGMARQKSRRTTPVRPIETKEAAAQSLQNL